MHTSDISFFLYRLEEEQLEEQLEAGAEEQLNTLENTKLVYLAGIPVLFIIGTILNIIAIVTFTRYENLYIIINIAENVPAKHLYLWCLKPDHNYNSFYFGIRILLIIKIWFFLYIGVVTFFPRWQFYHNPTNNTL